MALKIDFLFYAPEIESTKRLSEAETKHAIGVLRKKTGDQIYVTDGKGSLFLCIITDSKAKESGLDYQKLESPNLSQTVPLYFGICPTKNADRIEYFIEKAVELGVAGFYFLKSKHTVTNKVNLERMKKVALSAMKQSLRLELPEVYALEDFKKIPQISASFENKFICHLSESSQNINTLKTLGKTLVLIGPEGDFTEEELQSVMAAGYSQLSLGPNRLRTETAAVMAAAILSSKMYGV
jgi:16S rRNA (uracil1498-N3)-methyltransferase